MSTTDTQPTSLAAALAAVQATLPDVAKGESAEVETKTGRKYRYTYADLAAVTRAILPRLGAVGLSWTTKPTVLDGRFVLEYKLLHVSGESEVGIYPLPDRGSPQEIGSAITYARRYALCSVTGVAPDDDDDAAEATAGHRRDQHQPARPADESWESARPPGPPPPDPAVVRDWAVDPTRTETELRDGLAKLNREHPDTIRTHVVNEHGGDEAIGILLQRRIHDLAGPAVGRGEPTVAPAPESTPDAAPMATEQQLQRMHILFNELGYTHRDEQLDIINKHVLHLSKPVGSSKLLTAAEATQVINALVDKQARERQAVPA